MEVQQTEQLIQLVTFNIASEEYGIDILKVQEINRSTYITKIPNSSEFIDGVINLRSKLIPIINLRRKMGFPEKEKDNQSRIIIVEVNGIIVGFVVDSVSEVIRLSSAITEQPPALINKTDYITSVAKLDNKMLLLLDLEKLINEEEQHIYN